MPVIRNDIAWTKNYLYRLQPNETLTINFFYTIYRILREPS